MLCGESPMRLPGLRLMPTHSSAIQASARLVRDDDGQPIPRLAEQYLEREYLLSGTARRYAGPATGPATVLSDGHRYLTRIVARYPSDPELFSGRVVIEPFNTSTGLDRDVLWARAGSLLQVQGDAWIGVSARAASARRLKNLDPNRYGALDFSSNDLAWDVFEQLGRLVKQSGGSAVLPDLAVNHVYLGGYSQTGADTATFAMAFHAAARIGARPVYDGYFPASHAASVTPLASGTSWHPRFEIVAMRAVDVPVVQMETQTDVEGFVAELHPGHNYINPGGASVRRPDSDLLDDRYRLYEVAGAPHAARIPGCAGNGSDFPTSAFVRASLSVLFGWAEDGRTPPRAPRIALSIDDVVSVAELDEYGNAVGGVRSPFVDVPLSCYEVHSTPGPLCKLSGREAVLDADVLARCYGDASTYLSKFAASLDATIDAGFLLPLDRAALLASAAASAERAFAGGEASGLAG